MTSSLLYPVMVEIEPVMIHFCPVLFQTTGLVGLAVSQNPHEVSPTSLPQETAACIRWSTAFLFPLSVYGFSIPRSWRRCRPFHRTLPTESTQSSWLTSALTMWRRSVDRGDDVDWFKHEALIDWNGFYSQEPDIEKLEKKINCGQIEEVIFQVGVKHSASCQ